MRPVTSLNVKKGEERAVSCPCAVIKNYAMKAYGGMDV
jgi:hypothetical protein